MALSKDVAYVGLPALVAFLALLSCCSWTVAICQRRHQGWYPRWRLLNPGLNHPSPNSRLNLQHLGPSGWGWSCWCWLEGEKSVNSDMSGSTSSSYPKVSHAKECNTHNKRTQHSMFHTQRTHFQRLFVSKGKYTRKERTRRGFDECSLLSKDPQQRGNDVLIISRSPEDPPAQEQSGRGTAVERGDSLQRYLVPHPDDRANRQSIGDHGAQWL